MSVRITGFNSHGEAIIRDEDDRLLGTADLIVEDAHIVGVDHGDEFALNVKVVWTRHEAEVLS